MTRHKQRAQPAIDFKELSAYPDGDGLEAVTRQLGESLGFDVQWTGVGSDGGKDLIFIEVKKGPFSEDHTRWLVQCKDKAESARGVTDLGKNYSITDKLEQHQCQGFLLVTTTSVGGSLKAMIDGIAQGGKYKTLVWDQHELTKQILKDEHEQLFRQYFPKSHESSTRPEIVALRQEAEANFGFSGYEKTVDGPYSYILGSCETIPGVFLDYAFPQVKVDGNQSLDEANLLIRAYVLNFKYNVQKGRPVTPKLDFGYTPGDGAKLTIGAYGQVMEFTDEILSIGMHILSTVEGAAHPNHHTGTLNFQLNPTLPLELSDLFVGDYLPYLTQLCGKGIMRRKQNTASNNNPEDDEPEIVRADDPDVELDSDVTNGLAQPESALSSFCITGKGLVFIFDHYEVGSYAEGMFEILVPYSELSDYLNPEVLPWALGQQPTQA